MKSNYTFKHLDYSESLVTYTNEKLDEIGKFLLKEGRCTVYYWKDHHEFHCEVSINSKEKFFKAHGTATDVYVAVDLMIDKMEKQFLKVKEIYQDHKKFELSKQGRIKEINDQLEYLPKGRKVA
ncbi:MAG: ribosome-associated translation inhibitor RaiA [Bdellovibrionota bacterium]